VFVIFERPAFKESETGLLLQITQAEEVDRPVLIACVCPTGERRDEIDQPNGQNGNGSAAMIEEPAAHEAVIAVPTAVQEQEPELATRTKQRAKQQFQQNRFVIIGAGAIVLALLIFVATSMPSKRPAPKSKNGVVPPRRAIASEGSAMPGDKSLSPHYRFRSACRKGDA